MGVFPEEGPSDGQVSVQERNNIEREREKESHPPFFEVRAGIYRLETCTQGQISLLLIVRVNLSFIYCEHEPILDPF